MKSETNVATIKPQGVTEPTWSPEQLKLITDTVARGATKDELALFLYRCRAMDLDPLKPGQVHFIKYGNSPGSIVIGIEGFRSRAVKTGKLAGIKRGALKDAEGRLIGGWAEVYRQDWKEPAREEAPLSEYSTGKSLWAKMPETMIKKVAEAAALRMAFPDDLGGIYTREEMDQAEVQAERRGNVYPEQPAPGDGFEPDHGYKIPFGQYAKRSLEEVDQNDLRRYVAFLEKSAEKKGQPLRGQVAEFVERASEYIAAIENGDPAFDAEVLPAEESER